VLQAALQAAAIVRWQKMEMAPKRCVGHPPIKQDGSAFASATLVLLVLLVHGGYRHPRRSDGTRPLHCPLFAHPATVRVAYAQIAKPSSLTQRTCIVTPAQRPVVIIEQTVWYSICILLWNMKRHVNNPRMMERRGTARGNGSALGHHTGAP